MNKLFKHNFYLAIFFLHVPYLCSTEKTSQENNLVESIEFQQTQRKRESMLLRRRKPTTGSSSEEDSHSRNSEAGNRASTGTLSQGQIQKLIQEMNLEPSETELGVHDEQTNHS